MPTIFSERYSFQSKGMRLLRLAVTFGSIGLISYLFKSQIPDVIACFQSVNLALYLVAFVVFFGAIFCNSWRLKLFLDYNQIPIPLRTTTYYNFVALFFNAVLPSSLGGEAVKAYYLHRLSGNKPAVFSLVILDRLFGLICLLGLGSTALLLSGYHALPQKITISIFLMIFLLLVSLVLLVNRKIAFAFLNRKLPFLSLRLAAQVKAAFQAMHNSMTKKKLVAASLLLSITSQGFYILNCFLLTRSLGIDLPFSFFVFLVPMNAIVGLAPSINGAGVREAAYLFYATEYISPGQALALSLLQTSTLLFAGGIGGILYGISDNRVSPKNIS